MKNKFMVVYGVGVVTGFMFSPHMFREVFQLGQQIGSFVSRKELLQCMVVVGDHPE